LPATDAVQSSTAPTEFLQSRPTTRTRSFRSLNCVIDKDQVPFVERTTPRKKASSDCLSSNRIVSLSNDNISSSPRLLRSSTDAFLIQEQSLSSGNLQDIVNSETQSRETGDIGEDEMERGINSYMQNLSAKNNQDTQFEDYVPTGDTPAPETELIGDVTVVDIENQVHTQPDSSNIENTEDPV